MKPLLKWAGGKQKLLAQILPHVPSKIYNYYEPFFGGGAVFFNLPHQPENSFLSDNNEELINFYNTVKNNMPALITSINAISHTKEAYYVIRELDRTASWPATLSKIPRAARFLYLNKNCYNGLYRTNKQGQFNTPYGKYKNPTMFKLNDMKRAFHMFNKPNKVAFNYSNFDLIAPAYLDDFVYFDPPYHPVTKTSFVNYGPMVFGEAEQYRLAELCAKLARKNIKFLLSNSYCDFTLDLYRQYDIITINAKRYINSNAKGRGNIKEILVKNY